MPVELVSDCPVPVVQARTNGELASMALQYKQALELCNLDKLYLRKWAGEGSF